MNQRKLPLRSAYLAVLRKLEPCNMDLQFYFFPLQHVYVSLSELQVKKEEEINKNPISKGEEEIPENATEVLYQAMLPNLPQYMVSTKESKIFFWFVECEIFF